jgi:hypothetical protein
MSEQAAAAPAKESSFFSVPTKGHEITALGLSLLAVFGIVQIGAPIVRDLEFLDPKLRDYFIGIAFAAFPVIHRGTKKGLERFKSEPSSGMKDLSPWYVTGVLAAALLFAWNQFVSFLGGISAGMVLGGLGVEIPNEQALMNAMMIGVLAVSMPLNAVAAIFAGVALNRRSRSHAFLAVGLCAVMFVVFNVFTGMVFQGEVFEAQFREAAALGPEGLAYFLIGIAFVGVVIFVFGSIGVFISRFYREKSIGRLIDAARQLSPAERDALAAEINQRILAASGAAPPPVAAPS